MTNELSLSDIAAVTGSEGLGGNNAWVLILLFLIICGGGSGFGFGRGNELNQYATAASQQEILFGQQFQGLNTSINKVGDGLSSLGYSQLQTMNGMQSAISSAVVGEGRAIQTQLAQLNADQAARDCSIKEAVHAEGEATRAMIQQNKIESMQAEISELKTQQMFCGLPRINPYGYNVVPNNCCSCGNV